MNSFLEEYDKLYKKIDDFIKKVNPCKVVDGKCLRAQLGGNNFCCGKYCQIEPCKHLTRNGCGAEKPIACRLFLCQDAIDNLTRKQREKYYNLDSEYWHFKCNYNISNDFRLSKEEIVNDNKLN